MIVQAQVLKVAEALREQRQAGETRLKQLQQLATWLHSKAAMCQEQVKQGLADLQQAATKEQQADTDLSKAMTQWQASQQTTGFNMQVFMTARV